MKKGQSGNPKGRPPNPHKADIGKFRELITADDVQGILTSVIDKAKQGDIQAAKVILDRVLPVLKSIEIIDDEKTDNTNFLTELTEEELIRVINGG